MSHVVHLIAQHVRQLKLIVHNVIKVISSIMLLWFVVHVLMLLIIVLSAVMISNISLLAIFVKNRCCLIISSKIVQTVQLSYKTVSNANVRQIYVLVFLVKHVLMDILKVTINSNVKKIPKVRIS